MTLVNVIQVLEVNKAATLLRQVPSFSSESLMQVTLGKHHSFLMITHLSCNYVCVIIIETTKVGRL